MTNSQSSNQLALPLPIESSRPFPIINVASIPQRSPFRYPGGKTWFVPYIWQWLQSLATQPDNFIEPFAGGGIISLTVAFEKLAKQVLMVELDHNVAAVWYAILEGDAEWLAFQVENFELDPQNVDAVLSATYHTTHEQAFQTILKNRVNRGGILAPGAGRIKNGENGKGLKSRWYPKTLSKRIRDIAYMRNHINFVETDGLAVMREHASDPNAVFFIDPPYTASTKKAGSRLYKHFELDHKELFQIASTLQGNFLMTYDNAVEVYQLAQSYGFDTRTVAMKSTHHAVMSELLIGRNLDWL